MEHQCDSPPNAALIIGTEPTLGSMTIIISFFSEPILLGRSLLLWPLLLFTATCSMLTRPIRFIHPSTTNVPTVGGFSEQKLSTCAHCSTAARRHGDDFVQGGPALPTEPPQPGHCSAVPALCGSEGRTPGERCALLVGGAEVQGERLRLGGMCERTGGLLSLTLRSHSGILLCQITRVRFCELAQINPAILEHLLFSYI